MGFPIVLFSLRYFFFCRGYLRPHYIFMESWSFSILTFHFYRSYLRPHYFTWNFSLILREIVHDTTYVYLLCVAFSLSTNAHRNP